MYWSPTIATGNSNTTGARLQRVWEDDDGDDDNEAVLEWMDDDAPVWVRKGASKIGRSVVSTLYPYRTGFTDITYMDNNNKTGGRAPRFWAMDYDECSRQFSGSPSIPTQPTTETIERHGQTRKNKSRHTIQRSGTALQRSRVDPTEDEEFDPKRPGICISTSPANSHYIGNQLPKLAQRARERESETERGGYQEGFRNGPKTGRISHPSTTPKPKSHLHITTSSPNQTTLTLPHKNKNH